MPSRILVVNSGSSSLKFKLFDWVAQSTLTPCVSGLLERVGDAANSSVTVKGLEGGTETVKVPLKDHKTGLKYSFDILKDRVSSGIADEVAAVGHRVVHGGNFTESVLFDDASKAEVLRAALFAPLHNRANLGGVSACEAFFPGRPQAGVFDTAFHHTMPPVAYMYALPYELYEEQGVRRFGAHGTSYRYLTSQVAKHYGKPAEELDLIIMHLGAGASMCCVQRGKSVDTTMGMTPLEGLVMGTRCGDIDPGLLPFLAEQGFSIADIDKLMNNQSGLLGITGQADMRSVTDKARAGDARCQLAEQMFVRRIRKYLGAYLLQMNMKADAIVFSGGIGERSPAIRSGVCADLDAFGIALDEAANEGHDGASIGVVSQKAEEVTGGAKRPQVLVVPTDEELCIAQDTARLVSAAS